MYSASCPRRLADCGSPTPDAPWQILQAGAAAPLPDTTTAGAPGCWSVGAACLLLAGAGALGSGVMKAQSGPGASAAMAESANAKPTSNTENRFMVDLPYRGTPTIIRCSAAGRHGKSHSAVINKDCRRVDW